MIPWSQIFALLGIAASQASLFAFYKVQEKGAGSEYERLKLRPDVVAAGAVSLFAIILSIWDLYNPDLWRLEGIAALIFGISLPSLIYAVYLLLVRILKSLSEKYLKENEKWISWCAGEFYIRQEDENHKEHWVLRKIYKPYSEVLSKLSFALLIITMLILGIQQADIYHRAFSSVFSGGIDRLLTVATQPLFYALPVCSLLIVHTFALYLGGKFGRSVKDSIEKESFQGTRLSNYAAAANHLKKTFADALLLDEPPREFAFHESSPDSILNQLENSSEISDRAVAARFRIRPSENGIDPDYIRMSADLTAGRNVLIRNPFFQDLGPYLAYPLEQGLERGNKILVVCSGHESIEFIRQWLSSIFSENTIFEEKWKIRPLEDLVPECDIGILRYSGLCNSEVLDKNRAFFEQTEYVLLLNPSQVLTTLQMPLNVLCGFLKTGPVNPVFCIVDRNMSQIKDTISHVIKSPIQADYTVSAQARHQKLMIWNAQADFGSMERFEKQTEYLGGGIEIGAEAVSMQIPYTTWISERALPVVDLQNYAALGYPAICRVMKVTPGQTVLREKLRVSSSLFELKQEDAVFLVVEDEFNNPFTMANSYGTRGRTEAFINILSENYLLRDYFCANEVIFRTNEKSVPSLVPNFAKTNRNLLLKLILQILIHPMTEKEIQTELDLAGIDENSYFNADYLFDPDDEREKNPASFHTGNPVEILRRLLKHYTSAEESLFVVRKVRKASVAAKPEIITTIEIDPEKFERYFSSTLKNISYVLEDEALEYNVLDSKLYSLVLQTLLPGQFVSYGGKNYRVQRISPANGVVLQRASDRIDSRKTYRQIRHYRLPDFDYAKNLRQNVTINGFNFSRYEIDFSVLTTGYLEMNARNDLQRAIRHDFSADPSSMNFERRYRKKTVLLIRFPEVEQAVLYQIALLLQEIMPTVMPAGAPYLAVLARRPDSFTRDFESIVPDAGPLNEQVLVVVEDSDLDLGLLDCFEQSFFDLLEVIQDYLQWSADRLNPPENLMDFDINPDEINTYESLKKPESDAAETGTAEPDNREDEEKKEQQLRRDETRLQNLASLSSENPHPETAFRTVIEDGNSENKTEMNPDPTNMSTSKSASDFSAEQSSETGKNEASSSEKNSDDGGKEQKQGSQTESENEVKENGQSKNSK